MTRLLAVTLALAASTPAFAQGMSRGDSDATDASSTTTTGNSRTGSRTGTSSSESVAGVAEQMGVDTSACGEYLVPAHRDIVELRYIVEALPVGSLKREVAGRLDGLESDTASALGSLCGVRNLDRSPPTTFTDLDLTSVAGTVGSVFGNDIEIEEGGIIVQVLEAAVGAATSGRRGRRAREAEARATARRSGTTVDETGVADIIAEINAAPFADEKIAAFESATVGKSFTAEQSAEIVKAMPFAEHRVPVALHLYGQCTDPQNYESTIVTALPFASERTQFREGLAALSQ